MMPDLSKTLVKRIPLAVCAVWSLGFAALAQDSYPIGPGDVLSVSFLANPDLDRELQVSADGSIVLPLIGVINVQDQSIVDLREQIPILMTGAVYRERVNGEYLLVSVEPDEVIIDVERYRPVFVDGAVNNAGSQPFMVGMTARQAVAAAAGVEERRDATNLTGADLRNHPQVLLAELVNVLAEMALQEAVLNGSDDIDTAELDLLDAPDELVQDAILAVRGQLQTSSEILNEELAFLETSVEESESRVIAALRHEEAMTEILETEADEVARVESLVARRIVSSEVLTTTRRLYLQAVERLGNVQAERLAAEASRRELVLERNQARRERALQIQARLQELSRLASQLRVQIALSASVPLTLGLDEVSPNAARLVLFRRQGGQAQEVEATPETLLYPGDVLNVSFRN